MNMMERKYSEELVFHNIASVEWTYHSFLFSLHVILFLIKSTYPVFAFRNIYLESWSTLEDYPTMNCMLRTAISISKDDKSKKIIQKRYLSIPSSVSLFLSVPVVITTLTCTQREISEVQHI